VRKLHEFAETVLPEYFKHSNYASFVRQLNMYGFNRADLEAQAFQHPLFLRGKRENLALMKRKVTLPKEDIHQIAEKRKHELDTVMAEVKVLREKQAKFDKDVVELKAKNVHLDQENHVLWMRMNQAKDRQKAIGQKLRFVLMFLYKNYMDPKRTGNIETDPEFFAQDIPKLMDAAKEVGITVDGPDIDDSDDGPSSRASFYHDSRMKELDNDNDLERMPTIGSIGSFGGDDILAKINPKGKAKADNGLNRDRADSLQLTHSLFNTMESDDNDVNNLVRGLSTFFNDQDDTLRRLESLSSTLSDPLGDIVPIRDDDTLAKRELSVSALVPSPKKIKEEHSLD